MKKTSLILAVIALVGIFALTAKANPLFFPLTTQTSGDSLPFGTTTLNFMTQGTGTTTLAVDAYKTTPTGIKNGVLMVYFVGSSSPNSILRIQPEYSQGNASGTNCTVTQAACDWYQDGGVQMGNYATTSTPFDLGQAKTFQMAFASSTVGGAAGISSIMTRAIDVNVPTRYVRYVFTMPVGTSANGAVWAQFIPTKEQTSNK